MYIIKKLHQSLLRRPVIIKSGLESCINSFDASSFKTCYPKVGMALVGYNSCTLPKWKSNTQPFFLKTLIWIPLERIEVIKHMEETTEWCAGTVMVLKKSGDLCIWVDFTQLNRSVSREKYILPSVEQTLALLASEKIFTKLDTNMGFWQVPLTEGSAKMTTFITLFIRFFFKRLPFGIPSAPEYFQNRMSTKVTESWDEVVCHIDDVLIWGHTMAFYTTGHVIVHTSH